MLIRGRLIAGILVACAVVAAGISCQKKTEIASVDNSPKVDSVASADGVMIHYDVRGAGEHALVLVHCWSCDRQYWSGQADEFAGDYTVVTLDLAGHGESGMERDNYTMAAYGADVAAVVDKLGLNDVILVGHSMGGAVCIEAARLLPGKVKAMVGVDTDQDLVHKMDPRQTDQMLTPFRANFAGTTDMFVRALFPPDADTALVNHVAKDMASAPINVGLGSFENLFAYDAAEALKEAQVPIRCINSDRFPTDVEGNRTVAESFDVKYMPGRGHFLHMEDPAGFNVLLHETLAEFWPARN